MLTRLGERKFRIKLYLMLTFAGFLCSTLFMIARVLKRDQEPEIISSDGRWYYVYLPSIRRVAQFRPGCRLGEGGRGASHIALYVVSPRWPAFQEGPRRRFPCRPLSKFRSTLSRSGV